METTNILMIYTMLFWLLCYIPVYSIMKPADNIISSNFTDLSIISILLRLILFTVIYIIRVIVVFALAPFICALAIGKCIDKYLNN